MNIAQYQVFCEDFFKQGIFQSEDILNQKIENLNPEEFKKWNQEMILQYDKKYDVIRDIIKEMRDKENFVISGGDIDWDKDPVKQEENSILIRTYQNVYNDIFEKEMEKYYMYLKKTTELQDYYKQSQYKQSLKVEIEDKEFVAEQVIDVLWCGWECDDKVWLINDQGKKKIVASNHGQTYFADKEFLEEKIKEYQNAIEQTQQLLNQL